MAEVEGWMLGVAGHGRPTSRSPIRRWKAHHPSGIHSAEARPFVVLDFREGKPSAFSIVLMKSFLAVEGIGPLGYFLAN